MKPSRHAIIIPPKTRVNEAISWFVHHGQNQVS